LSDHQRLLDRLRRHCLDKVGTTEEFPFDERTVVFKVGGKMFCLVDVMEFAGCGLKCDPDQVPELRASYEGITTGPYLHPKHWNSVHPQPMGDVPWDVFLSLVDHSYDLVWKGLTQKIKMALASS
jgi:predicted DNA-binding protein (MmcQ/YjbR family)